MKSRKKKNNKLNILLALNKGIASLQSIELAMLFSHAGFNVNTLLLEGAEEQLSSELIKEITGHSPWSNSYKPGWTNKDLEFPVAIIIEPSLEFQKGFVGNNNENAQNSFIAYIKKHCKSSKILLKPDQINNLEFSISDEIIHLPTNNLKIKSVFEQILSKIVVFISSKALNKEIYMCIHGDLSNVEYLENIKKAFEDNNIKETESTISNLSQDNPHLSVFNEDKNINIYFENSKEDLSSSENEVYIRKHKNGLLLTDHIETRLLPDFSCQSCYSRLINYLKVSLTRKA